MSRSVTDLQPVGDCWAAVLEVAVTTNFGNARRIGALLDTGCLAVGAIVSQSIAEAIDPDDQEWLDDIYLPRLNGEPILCRCFASTIGINGTDVAGDDLVLRNIRTAVFPGDLFGQDLILGQKILNRLDLTQTRCVPFAGRLTLSWE